MNPDSFDQLSRRMGAARSRRGLLRVFAAGVAAVLVGVGTPAAEAQGDNRPCDYDSHCGGRQVCVNGRCQNCGQGGQPCCHTDYSCSGYCINGQCIECSGDICNGTCCKFGYECCGGSCCIAGRCINGICQKSNCGHWSDSCCADGVCGMFLRCHPNGLCGFL